MTFSARSSEYGLSGLEKTDFHAGSKYYGTRCTTKLELVGLANSCTGDYYSDTRVAGWLFGVEWYPGNTGDVCQGLPEARAGQQPNKCVLQLFVRSDF